ncbi:MAG: polysaccharide deacetylase family protein [Chitinophagales bacterium]
MIVFANIITPRLRYILDFLGKEIIGEPFQITNDVESFRKFDGPKINYSKQGIPNSEFRISNSELLFETGIREQAIQCFQINNYKAFFKTDGDFPFDIFAACFYLLSRYEEYLPHQKDSYGRYAYENSLAFKENFLHLPLINTWIEDFKKSLQTKFPLLINHHTSFRFIPTYDIDEAFSYKYKQWWRTAGGFMKSMVNGQWSMINERINVLLGKHKDPYDAFEWMNHLNGKHHLKPIYFFLIAGRTAKYDKNILPLKRSMKKLILEHSDLYSTGIHPSWQSGDDVEKLKLEILKLGHLSGKQIHSSRQHYIRFSLPDTYRQLIDSGIQSDFSMGYGSINGFRASVASPFYWYDLKKEEPTRLLLYPFCFMEANSFYEQKFSAQQALEELKHYYTIVRSVNGMLITIWHNSFLGTAKSFEGWRETYEQFISLIES